MDCEDEWCEYQEPHEHGFACDRQCLCLGVLDEPPGCAE